MRLLPSRSLMPVLLFHVKQEPRATGSKCTCDRVNLEFLGPILGGRAGVRSASSTRSTGIRRPRLPNGVALRGACLRGVSLVTWRGADRSSVKVQDRDDLPHAVSQEHAHRRSPGPRTPRDRMFHVKRLSRGTKRSCRGNLVRAGTQQPEIAYPKTRQRNAGTHPYAPYPAARRMQSRRRHHDDPVAQPEPRPAARSQVSTHFGGRSTCTASPRF